MKNRIIVAIVSIFAIMALTGCIPTYSVVSDTASHTTITPSQAMHIMAYQDVIILDVRTLAEFNAEHIPNAVSLPVDEIADAVAHMIPDKEQIILVYCRSGVRSADAANILASMGYVNVYDFGGIINWTGETQGASH